ncbi:hypothetical protein M569_10848 [Genlisea aurea]|uniref:Uncharacterized protein n=1 Tax=Genlisea aurea TaxID=192259 RepID=S8CAK0_9LAMI|nr:hypothetical protein M569_10848 [Genlisea aurea]
MRLVFFMIQSMRKVLFHYTFFIVTCWSINYQPLLLPLQLLQDKGSKVVHY